MLFSLAQLGAPPLCQDGGARGRPKVSTLCWHKQQAPRPRFFFFSFLPGPEGGFSFLWLSCGSLRPLSRLLACCLTLLCPKPETDLPPLRLFSGRVVWLTKEVAKDKYIFPFWDPTHRQKQASRPHTLLCFLQALRGAFVSSFSLGFSQPPLTFASLPFPSLCSCSLCVPSDG